MEKLHLAMLLSALVMSGMMLYRSLGVMVCRGDPRAYGVCLYRLKTWTGWTLTTIAVATAVAYFGKANGSLPVVPYGPGTELLTVFALYLFGKLVRLRMKRVYPYMVNALFGRGRR